MQQQQQQHPNQTSQVVFIVEDGGGEQAERWRRSVQRVKHAMKDGAEGGGESQRVRCEEER